ncbi:MAG TPA: sphingomyelin phosphodiesterase [Trueperaceae bacterium]|nr:sphingomyelin phosphodiesterase [Trueperaceae bacterium]
MSPRSVGYRSVVGRHGGRRLLRATLLCLLLGLGSCAPRQAPPQSAAPTLSPPRATDSHVLDVLTFNAALLPELVASTRQADRVAALASHLTGYDVLVLQELFVDAWRDRLLTELSSHYPYRTDIVGTDGARGNPIRQDGGIVILSRWPIVRQAQRTFGAVCSGTDCLADKGVAYAAVTKGRQVYHVFGTHAQSEFGFRVERVREEQFSLLRAFVDEQAIPADEPVLLAGDFNVDAATAELGDMLAALDAIRPDTTGSLRQTWDPQRNVWARGPAQWIDYVLVAADHLMPAASWNKALALRDGKLDLSDHFAVWGRVVLGTPGH